MARRALILGSIVALLAVPAAAELRPAPVAIGFGVSVPYSLPLDWSGSFSYLSAEGLLSENLTVLFDLGAYPGSFPNLYETGGILLVKGWVGPTAVYAGGGVSIQWLRVGGAWAIHPFLDLRAGYQIWLRDSFAIVIQFRTLQVIPLSWSFSPEIALGFDIGLGRGRPIAPRFDGGYIWLILGLGVAALLAFLPRN